MTDIKPELIEKAASAVRHERAYTAAAAFGVPLDDVGECAGMIAHAALSAVADDLRAEAWDEGYRLDWTGGVRHPNPYRQEV